VPAETKHVCPTCGNAVGPADLECGNCGENLAAPSAEIIEEVVLDAPVPAPQAAASPVSKNPQAASSTPQQKPRPSQQRASKPAQSKGGKANQTVTVSFKLWHLIVAAVLLVVGLAVVLKTMGTHGASGTETQQGQQNPAQPSVDLAALEQLRAAAEADPKNADALLRYANKLHDSRLIDQAIVQYRASLALQPDNADAGIDLGVCYFELKRYGEASAQMESVLAKHPEHQLGTFNLGIVKYNAGEIGAAEMWLKKAIAINASSDVAANATKLLDEIQKQGLK
jgi:Tfp pilus assembly protein PilF